MIESLNCFKLKNVHKMTQKADIISINVEDELKQSYLDYAMSVIVGRALPDVRDGLKPVHRRVLYSMHELHNDWNKAYKKSARVVGDVVGKYHPHGETAVYDTIVRMAQSFSMRYLLVDGQGNFGSVDGDPPAAMRYTEVRMTKITHALLADLDKDTVDFAPNYDDTEMAPLVLPAKVPNLLVNGSSGIAVGMATNIPPHNLKETIDACIAYIKNPHITINELMQYLPGPDFPTAAIIYGTAGIHQAYRTGRGRIYVRGRTHTETVKSGKEAIIITELPYQVNKARLIEKIAELVKEKKIEGIAELRDESDKDGMRVVIELKRGENPEILLNQLYNQTQLQNVFGINMVALIDGQPRTLNLHAIIEAFIQHRRSVVTRRSLYELHRSKERAHILEGLSVALTNIDAMISIIKSSKTVDEAKAGLLAKDWEPSIVNHLNAETICQPDDLPSDCGLNPQGYRLSAKQAQAILDLRLHRLTALEQNKILEEYKALLDTIRELLAILASPDKLLAIIHDELQQIKESFGDPRRTEIIESSHDISIEDLITEENVVVTLSHTGYIKHQPLSMYQAQKRGGKGKLSTRMKEEDYITKLVAAHSHDHLLCFSSYGKVYWLRTYQIPSGSRQAKGRPVVNLLPLSPQEDITAILPIESFADDQFVFMATTQGTVKKVPLKEFSRPRSGGIIALELTPDDHLVGVAITQGHQDVMLFSDAGKVNRFNESLVRAMGRTARGVRGIKLAPEQKVIDLIIVQPDTTILTATEYGFGKRTPVDEYRLTSRGGQGVISIQTSTRNGKVVRATQVVDNSDEIMLISSTGTIVRTRAEEIPIVGRNTQGVRLIQLAEGETLVDMQRIETVQEVE